LIVWPSAQVLYAKQFAKVCAIVEL
jgi:hypothetical protein